MAIRKYEDNTSVVLFQSGIGVPDHISPKSTLFFDIDAPTVYINKDNLANWVALVDTDMLTGATSGQLAIFNWRYSTNHTSTDPTSGRWKVNNISLPFVTEIYMSDICNDVPLDISALFAKVDGDWLLHIQQQDDANKFAQYQTSGPYIDNTGWWTIPISSFIQEGSGGGLTNNAKCSFVFVNQNSPLTTTSGTYTPTIYNTTNISGSSASICHYIRIGNQVTVAGKVSAASTSGLPAATVLGISLPIASNFSATTDASGSATITFVNANQEYLEANTSTDVVELKYNSLTTTNGFIFFTFTYTVI